MYVPLHLLVCDMSNFFTKSGNGLKILDKDFLDFLCDIHNVTSKDKTHF